MSASIGDWPAGRADPIARDPLSGRPLTPEASAAYSAQTQRAEIEEAWMGGGWWRKPYSEIMRVLAELTCIPEDDNGRISRSITMNKVMRIRAALDELAAAAPEKSPRKKVTP